ncbi:hypothetical protein [Paramuribaculum intestinale]
MMSAEVVEDVDSALMAGDGQRVVNFAPEWRPIVTDGGSNGYALLRVSI